MSKDNEKSRICINVDEVPGPDFTAYDEKGSESVLPRAFQDRLDAAQVSTDGEPKQKYSHSFPALTKIPTGELYGRALVCSAYSDTFWSITLRSDAENSRPPRQGYENSVQAALTRYVQKVKDEEKREKPRGKVKLRDVLGYFPRGYDKFSELVIDEPVPSASGANELLKEMFLNDIHSICNALYELLFPDAESLAHPSGLVAITGTTDSSKSLITRGLIFLYLKAVARKAWETGQRKPHLITFEDPIEQYFVKNPVTKTVPQSLTDLKSLLDGLYMDYTPREKQLDANNLKEVTRDALRQTPAVLFVGETREKDDWKDLLAFAGSGHLVVTTSHASSIVEAMTGIFRDTDTKTAAQRSEIARRILGIINIRRLKLQALKPMRPSTTAEETQKTVKDEPINVSALIPALWKNTPQSRNNLIADGLASLLPALGLEPEIGYYSRTHFADELTGEPVNKKLVKHLGKDDLVDRIKSKATEWDMEGV